MLQLPENPDSLWPDHIHQIWYDRNNLRMLFSDQWDIYFDNLYVEYLRKTNGGENKQGEAYNFFNTDSIWKYQDPYAHKYSLF